MSTPQVQQNRRDPTSVHNTGSHVDPDFPRTRAASFAFRSCQHEKVLFDNAAAKAEPDPDRLRRIRNCATSAFIMCDHATRAVKVGANYCEQRLCPICGPRRARKTARAVRKWLGKPKRYRWRFITLTLKSSEKSLKDQLDFLTASFRRLRQTHLWKNSQELGRGFIEVTYNTNNAQWHPHLHVLAQGNFIAQDALSNAWKKSSGGSTVVDVRALKRADNAAAYVAKYLGKAPSIAAEENALALSQSYYSAIRNRKMVLSYGNPGPLPDPEPEGDDGKETPVWRSIGSLDDWLDKADKGDELAIRICNALVTGDKVTGLPPPT